MCLDGGTMQVQTKFLWLQKPVVINDRIDDWADMLDRGLTATLDYVGV